MENTETVIYLHDIKLPKNGKSKESDAFADRFNDVSDSWAKANDNSLSEAERKEAMEEFTHKKICLEMGM